jgi:hypothetical protein
VHPGFACSQIACEPKVSCSEARCGAGYYCDDISGTAKCLPLPSCTGHVCESGTHCELKQVTCVRAPCPPQPTCVKDTSGGGGVACGPKTCGEGQICCSASCGICGTKGGACPAIACAEPF